MNRCSYFNTPHRRAVDVLLKVKYFSEASVVIFLCHFVPDFSDRSEQASLAPWLQKHTVVIHVDCAVWDCLAAKRHH